MILYRRISRRELFKEMEMYRFAWYAALDEMLAIGYVSSQDARFEDPGGHWVDSERVKPQP